MQPNKNVLLYSIGDLGSERTDKAIRRMQEQPGDQNGGTSRMPSPSPVPTPPA